jgi:hypothetical protein
LNQAACGKGACPTAAVPRYPGFPDDFNPYSGSAPALVFIETEPWASVIGSEEPEVLLYQDGDLIFVKPTAALQIYRYHHHKLTEAQLSAFQARIERVLNVGARCSYNFVSVSDLPEALFFLHAHDGRELATSVYGLMKPALVTTDAATTISNLPSGRREDNVPAELLELHRFLSTIDYKDSEPWKPKLVEAMILGGNSVVGDEPIEHWPKDWPGPTSDRSVKHRDFFYSIYIDMSLFSDKSAPFLTARPHGRRWPLPDEKHVVEGGSTWTLVEIGGRKWRVLFRSVFPNEPIWRARLYSK